MSKFCTSCGSEIPDGAAVCPSCGVSSESVQPVAYQQPNQQVYQQPNTQAYQQPYQQQYVPPQQVIINNQSDTSTTVIGWFGWLMLCSFLPFIGQIIMLASSKDQSAKNFAKLQLIFSVIGIIAFILVVVVGGLSITEIAQQMSH